PAGRRQGQPPARLRSCPPAPSPRGHGNRLMSLTAIVGARVFDGDRIREEAAVLVSGGTILDVVRTQDVPPHAERRVLDGGLLAPGFVDLQVNGGGGVLLNDGPSAEAIEQIAAAHRPFGTTGLLPTLITDM